MRNTRWLSLLGRGARRAVLAGGLCFCGWGCHQHYHYYGMTPGCPPGTAVLPSAVAAGPVCEVPADGTVVGEAPARSTVVSNGRRSRVVVSEPATGRTPHFGWRASDGDSPAVTQVEGAIQDSSVTK